MLRDLQADATGSWMRDGCRLVWQEFGSGDECVLLLPTWPVAHTDFWRHQVPVLAERYRVLTFDGLGNGASDRPTDPSVYSDLGVVEDALALLDQRGIDRAAVAGISQAGPWALALAALHPQRVSAAIFIGPNVPLAPSDPERVAAFVAFDEVLESHPGWSKWNWHYWLDHYEEFLRFFFGRCFTEPDSEAEIEHFVSMGLETTPQVLRATLEAPADGDVTPDLARELAARLTCPSLVLHGDQDAIAPLARGTELARLAGSQLHVLRGSGHEPHYRSPELTNTLILDFLESRAV